MRIDKSESSIPQWKHVVYGFKELNGEEINVWKRNYSMDDIKYEY